MSLLHLSREKERVKVRIQTSSLESSMTVIYALVVVLKDKSCRTEATQLQQQLLSILSVLSRQHPDEVP